jgi:aldehyde:ferredoxin oxidoreductase
VAAVIPGCHGNLLQVDLSTTRCAGRRLDEATVRKYIGGTGLGARILFGEIEPRTDSLSPEAVLLFLAGPFAGTRVPCGDRASVICKSPLTGIWAESDVGGRFTGHLRSCGFDGLVIQGRSDSPVYLHLSDGSAEIRKADFLWGQDTFRTHEMLER